MSGTGDHLNPRSLIALDYGRRRVGVAGCSGDVPIAFGITTLIINGLHDLLAQLRPILKERDPSRIVIGFPLTLGDTPGALKNDLLKLRSMLLDAGYEVCFVDEALSSRSAAEMLRLRGKKSQKEELDRAAAALILQQFLDGNLQPLAEEDILGK